MAHTQHDKQRMQNGQPKPGQPRPSLAAVLPKPPDAVAEHAREIMHELIALRRGMSAEAVAKEAFDLARAFRDEAQREHNLGAESNG